MSLDALLAATWISLGALTGLFALAFFVRAFALARAPRFEDHDAPDCERWPRLSVVIPAKDEESTLALAIASLLAQDYPDLEVVLVDDRSQDRTPALIDGLAEMDPRVTALHIAELPAGWLGKVHAQQRGLELATGEWLLLADADTEYHPGALRRAMALAEKLEVDHLSLMPKLRVTGPLQAALIANFHDTYVERSRGRTDPIVPRGGPGFGFGAFNLVRREAFEQTKGLEWVKLDIADDLALGEMMRDHGRSAFLSAPQTLSLLFYPSARAALEGWEKNAFGILARFSLIRALAMAVVVTVVGLAPAAAAGAALLPAAPAWFVALVAAAVAAVLINAVVGARRLGRTAIGAALVPLAFFFMAFALVRGGLLCHRRGGVMWRGQLYPVAALKTGQRSRF